MKPPKRVRVGPHRYRVRIDDSGALGDAGRAGQCSPSRLTITIDDEQEGSQLADTLLHELGHALLQSVGLEEEIEERACAALGPGLLALINDNPKLIEWLQALKEKT